MSKTRGSNISIRPKPGIKLLGVGLVLLLAAAHLGRSSPPPLVDDLNAYVREIVANELHAQDSDRSCWIYTSQTLEGSDWRAERVVETDRGTLTGILTENGRTLTPKEQELDEDRLRSLVRSPHAMSREAADRQHDWEKIKRLARLLPDGFLYTQEATEGQKVRLSFRPNPRFEPPISDAVVFRAVVGNMVIDTRFKRIVNFRAQLWSDLEFGWGLLGRLHKGGTFEVSQEQVAPGYWEVTSLNVNITGRVLFFRSFGELRHETRSDFSQIPESTPLEAAAELLRQDLRVLRQRLAGTSAGR